MVLNASGDIFRGTIAIGGIECEYIVAYDKEGDLGIGMRAIQQTLFIPGDDVPALIEWLKEQQ